MMDPTIVAVLTVIATAVLNRAAEIPVEKGAEAIISWFANAIRKKPELRKAAEQVSNNPDDPVARKEVEQQVLQLLHENPEQARQLLQYIHLSDYVGPMRRVTDKKDDMKRELVLLRDRISTTEGRLHQASSLYVIARDVLDLHHTVFPSLQSLELTAARGMRLAAVVTMIAYSTLVLMRDRGIEEALAELPDDHLLKPFKDFFSSGTAQHLRNAIGAGSFVASKYFDHLVFFDGDWIAYTSTIDFLDLCERIRWFYAAIYLISTSQNNN